NAPDIIIGYNKGYRTSFESAKGIIEEEIISDNLLCWVGDHSIDPEFVKGVCITNFTQKADPEIIDIAPTVLKIMGTKIPEYIDGKSLI
ncbi:MAG: nucleotide pyrophosphatase, partial [Candidatus Hydrogenedentota bacterium]